MKGTRHKARTERGIAIGLTGGLACGKSVVAAMLAEQGAAVRDADDVAHELMAPGQRVYRRVVARFGRGILRKDGVINRRALGRIVFADARERAALNRIVHPAVLRECRRWLRARIAEGRVAVAVIPLLFEVGETQRWDAIVCVAASPGVVRQRLRKRRLSEQEIRTRLAAQMPLEEKTARADHVIWNNGSLRSLERETRKVYGAIVAKGRRSHGRRTRS